MEVHFPPELEARLNEMAATTGREKSDLVKDATASYLEELSQLRGLLDTRYEDMKSGKVKHVDGEEAFARLRRKSEERHAGRS
jgi:predicted DNA-binding protein